VNDARRRAEGAMIEERDVGAQRPL
jgi:hypothetical protein